MPTIETFQITSNAIAPQSNSTVNSYGIMVATYDVGSVHMAVQGTFDHFTVPTGTDQVSMSLIARADNTAANVGVNCYLCSTDRTATSTTITFSKVVNGVISVLKVFSGTSVPNTQLFEFDCAGTAPVILTGKYNGQTLLDSTNALVTYSDNATPITTGTRAGVHWFSTTATPDVSFASFAAFAIPAPPVTTTRSVLTWPFQGGDNTGTRCAPWNMPRGDGCTFNTSSGPVGNGQLFDNGAFGISSNNGFGVEVGGAGYPLVVNNTNEGHYSIYRADGVTADEYYAGVASGETVTSFTNKMATNVKGLGVGVGFDVATELSQLGGCLRKWDFDNLATQPIQHALQILIGGRFLTPNWVWPAIFGDGYRATNSGFVPYGALVAIPTSAVIPAGCNAIETAIWTALRNYGAYIADGQGSAASSTSGFMSLRAEAAAQSSVNNWRASAQGLAIGKQIRWVTNNTTDSGVTNLGGPGTRLAPFAPLV